MKRTLLTAGGAILATGVLIAGLGGTVQATPIRASQTLAASPAKAAAVAEFWLGSNGDALKKATEYAAAATKLAEGADREPDGKAGLEQPTGVKKVTTAEVANVSLPKTMGMLFFQTGKGEPKWCSATSLDAVHRNLVATAAHCVYDVTNNGVVKNWIFIPDYYQGNAPWGIYVGKTAYMHHDFRINEDFERDYAFVTVYSGFTVGTDKPVAKSVYDAHKGAKYVTDKEITEREYVAGIDKYGANGPYQKKSLDPSVQPAARPKDASSRNIRKYLRDGVNGVKLAGTEVTEAVYTAAPGGKGSGNWENSAKNWWKSGPLAISRQEYDTLSAAKADGTFLGKLTAKAGAWFKQQFHVNKWVKTSVKEVYVVRTYFVEVVTDRGPLGRNVGGQGFGWNQRPGQPVFVFGYPAAPHADGTSAWTGATPKWCHSPKPSGHAFAAPAYQVEEHLAIKCAMTGGADGGPWLIRYGNAKRVGYLTGVTSLFADQDGNRRVDTVSAAPFDGEANTIYRTAAGQPSGSIVGKDGAFAR